VKPLFLLGLVVCMSSSAFSQDILPWDKKAEKEKFHSKIVRGMSAAETSTSYAKRLRMEDASPFGALLWRNVGPESQSGRVMMIASPESKPNQMYVAFATGGLFRTEDEGQTWTSLWDNQPSFGIGDFAVTKDGQTIYVGTGEANNQRTSYSGTGVYKSTDAGKTWSFAGLPESHHINRIIIDPKNENVIYAAVMGHLYSQNSERGLYKSTDGGKTWVSMLSVDEWTGCTDVQLNPKNSNVVLAAMYFRDRRAWNFLESGPGSGVHRSEDGGKTWKPIPTLPSGESCGRVGLSWAKSNEKVVYAMVENPGKDGDWGDEDERVPTGRLTVRRFAMLTEEVFTDIDMEALKTFWTTYGPNTSKIEDVVKDVKDKKMTMADVRALIEKRNPQAFSPGQNDDEIYKSVDGGKTFTRLRKLGGVGGYYFDRAFVNPMDENDIWLCATPVLRSTDGGQTWKNGADGSVHVDYHAVYFDPRAKGTVWVGNDGGAYVSRNNGKSWSHIENLSVGQTTTLAVDNATPYNIYTGLQDNGTMKGPSTYIAGVSNPNLWEDIGGGDGSAIAIDPREDGLVFIASQFGAHQARNLKTNAGYSARPRAPQGETQRANWISPIILSPHHPDLVYVGFNRLYRSFDRGRTYKPISPDLTRNRPNGDVPHSTIKDLSESPLKFGLIYCGADDGRMTMTSDGGNTWTDIPTPQPEKWISRVVASKFDEGTVYVSQSGYREDDWSAYLWKSTDYGKTWTSIAGNLPAETINVVREDPKNKNILYVGTDMGVFITFDGGATWETLHGGLSHIPVHDLVIQERENDLVIATHARGCFVLNLKTVQSITPELRKEELKVLSLADGIRGSWGYERRPEYSSDMPRVPTVKVSFFAGAAGKGKLEIVDKDGKVVLTKDINVVNGFNNEEIGLRLSDEKFDAIKPEKPKTGKDAVKDPFEANRAKYLAAGTYKFVLTVNGKKVEKDWKLE